MALLMTREETGKGTSRPREPVRAPRWFAAVALSLVVVLFGFGVYHHYFLGDDCFISFRYAQHLVAGEGLVWNPGERVEGYTNFLWVLLLAGGLFVGIPPEIFSVAVGVVSGTGLLAAVFLFSAREWGRDDLFVWVAPLALAANRSFTGWSSGGLETMFFSLLVFLAFAAYLRERDRDSSGPVVSSLLFAAATLTRPEGALFACIAGALFGVEILQRRRSLRAGLIWATPLAVMVGTHLLWRYAYYGAWLPNSFHAKVPGVWWEQGWRYLTLFAEDYRIVWFLPGVVAAVLLGRRFAHVLFASAISAYLIYVAGVGGDRFEFRFLVVVLPYLYWLIADGLRRIAGLGVVKPRVQAVLRTLAVAAAAALILTTLGASFRSVAEEPRYGVASLEVIRDYANRRADTGRFLRGLIDAGIIPEDAVLGVSGAGALPYYTGWPTVDLLGINDKIVARMPIADRGVIGHERWAPYDYLAKRQVAILDIFNRLVFDDNILAGRPRVRGYGSTPVPLKGYHVDGKYLIFGTAVSDEVLRRLFNRLEPVGPETATPLSLFGSSSGGDRAPGDVRPLDGEDHHEGIQE
jgi:hypothetical protein